jgi:regulator of protease activity HflC (stomatin/prohibitin superfamily)
VDVSQPFISDDIDRSVINRTAFIPFVLSCTVESYENGLLFVDKKFVERLEPGKYLFWKALKEPTVLKVDLRQIQMEISGQEMLTADKAALRMNFYVRYKVADVAKAILDNKDFEKQLYVLVQLALREYVGKLSLDELLDSKQQVTENVLKSVGAKGNDLGVEILDAGVKDIILPGDVKEIMNRVLVAQKQAQANVITRREETASTRSMLNTAKIMEENEMLYKLKEMEYVEKIAEKIGDITLSGNGQVLNQLKDIFSVK